MTRYNKLDQYERSLLLVAQQKASITRLNNGRTGTQPMQGRHGPHCGRIRRTLDPTFTLRDILTVKNKKQKNLDCGKKIHD